MAKLIKRLWNVAWDMWLHWNGTLHDTDTGRQLIVDGNLNKKVIRKHTAGRQGLL